MLYISLRYILSPKKAGGRARGRWPFWFAREKEGFPLILEGFTFGLGDEEVEWLKL